MDWTQQSVLITGGTGSFGRKLARVLLDEYRPQKLIIFSRDELKQHEMRTQGFEDPALRFFIGDVRDADRLRRAFHGVDVVVHAAALKQVPVCEYNPIEGVMTNIMGARNVIEAALDTGVSYVLGLSTDKAVNPVNLYGATKLVAEKLFVQANAYRGDGKTKFSCCRYGNVVGSRGSVIPLFEKQRETGVLTITDDRMTRFWMTLDSAVHFVIDNIERMQGGEVFVPRIPSMNILDLARAVAPECDITRIGIRPGEKLHEVLVSEDEARHTLDLQDHFLIKPASAWWPTATYPEGTPVPAGFTFASDTNDRWLTGSELTELIGG